MSDAPKTGSPSKIPQNPKLGTPRAEAAKVGGGAVAPAIPVVAQGGAPVRAATRDNTAPAVNGALNNKVRPASLTAPVSAPNLTAKIDAVRPPPQSEGSTVKQGLQSITAVIGENYQEELKPVDVKSQITQDVSSIPINPRTPAARPLIVPATQETRNEVAMNAISDSQPPLTNNEQDISQSQQPATVGETEMLQAASIVEALPGSTIADLLNQLKSDITTLAKGDLAPRQQLNMPAVIDSASTEVKTLLAELQGDITALRSENNSLKMQFKVPKAAMGQSAEVAQLLGQLQGDITDLRQENDSLRGQYGISQRGSGELSSLLAELQGDISGLRQENDSFKAVYSSADGRDRRTSASQAFLMTLGLVVLVGGAAVGGIYYANSINDQNNEDLSALLGLQKENSQKVAALEAAAMEKKITVIKVEKVEPKVVVVKPAPAPVVVAPTPPVSSPALPKLVVKRPKLDSTEVKALLVDAQNLIELGDIVSARQVLEYAMSQQSAEATFRLAETFDPLRLATMASVLSVEPNITRAKVLYYAAAKQGHQGAAKRLAELR